MKTDTLNNEMENAPAGQSADHELEQSLRELADIKFALDQSSILAITDQQGVILYANDQFCRISKYSKEELIGQDHRIINSGYHSKEFIRELWTTIASGHVWKGEFRNRAKDGTLYWVDTTIVPFLNEEGKPYQYVAIRNDITEKKQMESELMRTAQLSLLGELAASLAHEIKNPLAGIQGTVDILIRRRQAGDPERIALEGIRGEVVRIDTTVRALLDRARPRAIHLALTSLTEVVRHAVTLGRGHAVSLAGPARRIDVEFNLPSDPMMLHLDAPQIEDAVLNLIINAIEAIDGEGHVNVRLSLSSNTDSPDAPGEAIVEVEDTGRGISVENLARIFAPFYTTTKNGTGLGLPAVRRIARAHGGRVDVTSTPDLGSTFRLHLPLLKT
jgi:PAS domain S-box-containing protein